MGSVRLDGKRWSKAGYGNWHVPGSDDPRGSKRRCRKPIGWETSLSSQLLLVSCLRLRVSVFLPSCGRAIITCRLGPCIYPGAERAAHPPLRYSEKNMSFRLYDSIPGYSPQYLNTLRQAIFSLSQHTCANHLAPTSYYSFTLSLIQWSRSLCSRITSNCGSYANFSLENSHIGQKHPIHLLKISYPSPLTQPCPQK